MLKGNWKPFRFNLAKVWIFYCLFFIANGIDVSLFRAVESQRDDARKEGLQRGSILDELQNERSDLRNSIVGFQTSIKRLESEREDIVKCLEEARKRIAGIVIGHFL